MYFLACLILTLILNIFISKYYIKKKLNKNTEYIKELERKILLKEELLLQNIKLASFGKVVENIISQWRNPLFLIKMIGSNLTMKQKNMLLGKYEISQLIDLMNSNILELSNSIKDFSVLHQNSKMKSYFKIEQSFKYVLDILKPKLNDSKIKIHMNKINMEIYTYKNELIQIFLHIMSNSINMLCSQNKLNKCIFIKIERKGKDIIIQIYDNNQEVSKEYIQEAFNLDFKGGVNLGLYSCKRIIEKKLNGQINIRNYRYYYKDKEEEGTLLYLKIPVVKLDLR